MLRKGALVLTSGSILCHCLETHLGYRQTITIDMGTENGTPIYTMVFATDSEPGIKIMEPVLRKAREESAGIKSEQRADRERSKRQAADAPNLFDSVDLATPRRATSYELDTRSDSESLPRLLVDD